MLTYPALAGIRYPFHSPYAPCKYIFRNHPQRPKIMMESFSPRNPLNLSRTCVFKLQTFLSSCLAVCQAPHYGHLPILSCVPPSKTGPGPRVRIKTPNYSPSSKTSISLRETWNWRIRSLWQRRIEKKRLFFRKRLFRSQLFLREWQFFSFCTSGENVFDVKLLIFNLVLLKLL